MDITTIRYDSQQQLPEEWFQDSFFTSSSSETDISDTSYYPPAKHYSLLLSNKNNIVDNSNLISPSMTKLSLSSALLWNATTTTMNSIVVGMKNSHSNNNHNHYQQDNSMKIINEYSSPVINSDDDVFLSSSQSSFYTADDATSSSETVSTSAAALAVVARATSSVTTTMNTNNDGVGGTSTSPSSFETMRYIKIGLLAIMFILIFCGNTFVLIALNNRKLRKNRMYFFLVHLSIADLVTGFFNVIPQLAWEVARRFYGGNFLCKMVKFLQILGPYLSSYILVVTSIDRYQAICHPLSNHQNTRRSRWMVAIAWTLSLLYCTPQCIIFSYQKVSLSTDDYECWATFPEPWMLKMYVTWYAISVFMVPFLILTWTHYFICREIWLNWHSKRQSLLVKPDLINKKNTNNNTDSIDSTSKINEILNKNHHKSYSLSTSLGVGVNQIIHRLSNSGLETDKNEQQQQQCFDSKNKSKYRSVPTNNNFSIVNNNDHHQNQTKTACRQRRFLWFSRKSSSTSSASSSSSDSSQQIVSTSGVRNVDTVHIIQKCPLHHHQFRHHPSKHENMKNHRFRQSSSIDQDDIGVGSHQKESINNKNESMIDQIVLKRAKSESELLYKKQEKEMKLKRFLNGSLDSLVSIEEFHGDNLRTSQLKTANELRKFHRDSLNTDFIRMTKSDKIIYENLNYECLDKRIKQWMIFKQQPIAVSSTKCVNKFLESRNNLLSLNGDTGGGLLSNSSSLNCICCPQCCAYCHQNHRSSIESHPNNNLAKEMPYNNGSININNKNKIKLQKQCSITNNNQQIDSITPSTTTIENRNTLTKTVLVMPSVDGDGVGGSTIQSTTVSTITTTTTPNTNVNSDSNNVVNVFVPRTYHINAGNKRMSNPRIHSMHGLTRAKIKTVKITMVVITCYVLCSTPFIFVQLWAQFWPNAHESPIYKGPIIAILMLLPSLNSCVNPWIYIYFNPNLITLFCQFFKRKSTCEDPASKSCSLQNNNGTTMILGHTKLHKKATNDSPECSLMSMNECRTSSRADLFDLNKKCQISSNSKARTTSSLLNNHQQHLSATAINYNNTTATTTTTTTATMLTSHHHLNNQNDNISDQSISMNSLVQAFNMDSIDDQWDRQQQQKHRHLFYHRGSSTDSFGCDTSTSSNIVKNTDKKLPCLPSSSTEPNKKTRRHSISVHLDRMWAKLSLKNSNYRQEQQQPQQPKPIKSSHIRLYKTTNVECVVENDQFIV